MSKKPEDKEKLAKNIANRSKKLSARIENLFSRISHFFSVLIDRIFFKPQFTGIVSLIIAILLYVLVSSSAQMTSSVRSSIELNGIELDVLANTELYEISGLPDQVDAIVQGEFVDLTTTRNQGNYSVVVDLIGLSEGVHLVNLEPVDFSPRVRVTLSPSSAEVTIKRKISEEFNFDYDFINLNKLSREYVLSEPTFDVESVLVQASRETINQISFIKALIDVTDRTESFTTEANLVAYDQEGLPMNIDIFPEVVTASVNLSSPNKQVPLVVNPVGTIPDNQSIESITLDEETITIYGSDQDLASINQIDIVVNASTLTSDTNNIVHSITLPSGVKTASLERVQVEIKLAPTVEQVIENSHVFIENNVNNYEVEFMDEEDGMIDVTLTGSQAMIDRIDFSQVRVSIDLRNITPGEHEVIVSVTGPSQYLDYSTSQSTILIEVKE